MIYDFQINLSDLNSPVVQAILAVKENSKVLEVGCATGYIGEVLAQKGCQVTGIEYHAEMAEKARSRNCYQQVLNLDLNRLEPYPIEPVEHIVMTDVIEHLLYPDEVVSHLANYLTPEGTFLFSIPNISHGSIKLKLLLNQFNYTPMGLLDSTHIKFFTLQNIVSFMTRHNLEILRLKRSWADISTWDQPVDVNVFPGAVYDFVKTNLESYAYQYFVEVKKTSLSAQSLLLQNASFLTPAKEDYLACQQYCQAFN